MFFTIFYFPALAYEPTLRQFSIISHKYVQIINKINKIITIVRTVCKYFLTVEKKQGKLSVFLLQKRSKDFFFFNSRLDKRDKVLYNLVIFTTFPKRRI